MEENDAGSAVEDGEVGAHHAGGYTIREVAGGITCTSDVRMAQVGDACSSSKRKEGFRCGRITTVDDDATKPGVLYFLLHNSGVLVPEFTLAKDAPVHRTWRRGTRCR